MDLQIEKFGDINFILGNDGGKYPYCNTLFIDDENKTIVDPACSFRFLRKFSRESKVDRVILSHYHEDHVRCVSLFEDSEILTHKLDLRGVQSVQGLMECYGADAMPGKNIWLNFLINGIKLIDLPLAKAIENTRIDFGKTYAEVVHLPGHTPGHFGLLFPNEQVFFSADIDLDKFGPYYGDAVSSISDMLCSIDKVYEISPKVLLTSHTAGVVKDRIRERLIEYKNIVFQREEKILKALEKPLSVAGICKMHLIYGKQFEPRTIFNLIESNMIRQHLTMLISEGRVDKIGSDLYIAKG